MHPCVPSFQPGPLLSLLPGITGSQALGKIRHDFFFPIIQVQSSPQPPCSTRSPPHTISKTHSKHIVPSGGFAQPTLSLVLRREDLRNPSQHVGLSTSDRVLERLASTTRGKTTRVQYTTESFLRIRAMREGHEASIVASATGSDAPKQRLQNRLIPSSQARSAPTVAPSSESFPATRNPDPH
jgi:hypothetical protein